MKDHTTVLSELNNKQPATIKHDCIQLLLGTATAIEFVRSGRIHS
jgi:hypothetical protein